MVELNREYLVGKHGKMNLFNLTQIDLWGLGKNEKDKIKKIDSNTFKNLTKLETLWLQDNAIEEIDVRLFETLSNLKELELYNNKLKRIDSNTFKNLTKLEKLYLNNNEIEEIDVRLFESLSNLKVLYLYNNKLKEIDRKCFESLKSIEVIEIYENVGLNVLSFIKPSVNKYSYDYDKIEKYGSISEWNKFLHQFPALGNIIYLLIVINY